MTTYMDSQAADDHWRAGIYKDILQNKKGNLQRITDMQAETIAYNIDIRELG